MSAAGVLGKLRSMLGQDIRVGNEPFDEEFIIQASQDTAPVLLLTETIREDLVALVARSLSGFSYDKGEVRVQLVGIAHEPDVVRVAVDLVVEAARWSV